MVWRSWPARTSQRRHWSGWRDEAPGSLVGRKEQLGEFPGGAGGCHMPASGGATGLGVGFTPL